MAMQHVVDLVSTDANDPDDVCSVFPHGATCTQSRPRLVFSGYSQGARALPIVLMRCSRCRSATTA